MMLMPRRYYTIIMLMMKIFAIQVLRFQSLIPAIHRVAMVEKSLESYDFVKCSKWEVQQTGWNRTLEVLQEHHTQIKEAVANPSTLCQRPYLPTTLSETKEMPHLMMICGGDLLESFSVPDLWKPEDMEKIVRDFGLVVVKREGSNPEQYIEGHAMLKKYRNSIHIVTETVPNDISSTRIRNAVKSKESVKFLVAESVIDYIKSNNLYS